MSQSASQQMLAAAQATETLHDARGRALEVRRTTTMERRALTRACGKDADIDRWFGEAMVAVQCRTIDGVPVPMPRSSLEVDQLVAKLDDDALVVIAAWLNGGGQVPPADPTPSPPTPT